MNSIPERRPDLRGKDLALFLLDYCFVPSSIVRAVRKYGPEVHQGYKYPRFRQGFFYTSAVIAEVARLGLCYTMVIDPLQKSLGQ